MPKHIFLLATFIFVTDCFLCEGQANRAAVKGGTLSTSTSSGGGAVPGCELSNFSPANFLCIDSNTVLSLNYDSPNGFSGDIKWYSTDASITIDPTDITDDGASSTLTVRKPGIYYFDYNVLGSDCYYGWTVTSTIPIQFPQQTIFCTGGTVTLQAPAGTFSYQWFKDDNLLTGAISNSYVSSQTGNYYVHVTDQNNCNLNSDKINVTVYAPPSQLDVTGDSCTGSTLVLDNSISDLYPETITWYRDNSLIKSFDNHGTVVAGGNGAGSGLNQLNQPYGIFLDSMKNIYVADYNNYRIVKWAPGSTTGETVAGNLNLITGNPTDVLLDLQSLYISSTENIFQFTPPFILNEPFSHNVWGLSISQDHNLYFANDAQEGGMGSTGAIYKTDSTGMVAGNGILGAGLSSINYPNGIYVDSLSNFYVADNVVDSLNNFYGRIVKWAPGATSGTLIAGGSSSWKCSQPDMVCCRSYIRFIGKHVCV